MNFFLETQCGGDAHQHHDNTERNCRDGNFYYWRRNTTFIILGSNDAPGDEKFEIHKLSYAVIVPQKYHINLVQHLFFLRKYRERN